MFRKTAATTGTAHLTFVRGARLVFLTRFRVRARRPRRRAFFTGAHVLAIVNYPDDKRRCFLREPAVEERRRRRRRRRSRRLPPPSPSPLPLFSSLSLSLHVLVMLPEDLSRHGGPDRLLHRARKIAWARVSRGETRHLSTSASFTDTHAGAGSQSTILTHVTVPRINTLHAHAFVPPPSFLPSFPSFFPSLFHLLRRRGFCVPWNKRGDFGKN